MVVEHVFRAKNHNDTMELGQALGHAWLHSKELLCVLLYGEMGSGKTTLTRGLVSALPGADCAEVSSPSFTLCNMYPTSPELVHCDLYRNTVSFLPEEAEDALERGAWIIIEWAERLGPDPVAAGCPSDRLDIYLESCHNERSIRVHASGAVSAQIVEALIKEWPSAFSDEGRTDACEQRGDDPST